MLDSVITLAIGRNYGENVPLSQRRWTGFQRKAHATLAKYATVVAHTEGQGIGSDDEREAELEDSAVLVAINATDLDALRRDIARTIKQYGQSSAAFAIDKAHEPVFATRNGYRA